MPGWPASGIIGRSLSVFADISLDRRSLNNAEQRLSQASNGNVIVAFKTPYDDGTSHVVLSPMEFMGRLAAWVPKPRVT